MMTRVSGSAKTGQYDANHEITVKCHWAIASFDIDFMDRAEMEYQGRSFTVIENHIVDGYQKPFRLYLYDIPKLSNQRIVLEYLQIPLRLWIGEQFYEDS